MLLTMRMTGIRRILLTAVFVAQVSVSCTVAEEKATDLRAGAVAVDITPDHTFEQAIEDYRAAHPA